MQFISCVQEENEMAKKENATAPEPKPAAVFAKRQFTASKQFTAQQKDVLNALLEDDRLYTVEEVNAILEAFYHKEV